jgi:hypothetical protein
MALIFNDFAKNGLANYYVNGPLTAFDSTVYMWIYNSSVSFPTTSINFEPAGWICRITVGSNSFTANNGIITLNTVKIGTPTGSGLISWWFLGPDSSSYGNISSDSVGWPGDYAVATFDNLYVTAGQPLTLTSFNLKVV